MISLILRLSSFLKCKYYQVIVSKYPVSSYSLVVILHDISVLHDARVLQILALRNSPVKTAL
jgi:hypothetical protein